MSEENVEIVRQGSPTLAKAPTQRSSKKKRAGRIAPDAELDFSDMYLRSMPWGGSVKLEPERFFDVDDERVLVFVHVTAEGMGSGVPVEMRNAYELTIRDGALVRWKVYADRAAALEAAGLSE